MKQMEDLVESILDYIRADYTDYAVMINGEWGSGKTYFFIFFQEKVFVGSPSFNSDLYYG